MTVMGIGMTVLICAFAVFLGKRDHNRGIGYTDELIKTHAQYSPQYAKIAKIERDKMD